MDKDIKQTIRVITNRLDTQWEHFIPSPYSSLPRRTEKKSYNSQPQLPLVIFVLCIKPPHRPGVEPGSPNRTLYRLTMGPQMSCLSANLIAPMVLYHVQVLFLVTVGTGGLRWHLIVGCIGKVGVLYLWTILVCNTMGFYLRAWKDILERSLKHFKRRVFGQMVSLSLQLSLKYLASNLWFLIPHQVR